MSAKRNRLYKGHDINTEFDGIAFVNMSNEKLVDSLMDLLDLNETGIWGDEVDNCKEEILSRLNAAPPEKANQG